MYYGLILNIKQNHGFKPWDGVKKKKKMVDMGITATKLSWYGLYQLE